MTVCLSEESTIAQLSEVLITHKVTIKGIGRMDNGWLVWGKPQNPKEKYRVDDPIHSVKPTLSEAVQDLIDRCKLKSK